MISIVEREKEREITALPPEVLTSWSGDIFRESAGERGVVVARDPPSQALHRGSVNVLGEHVGQVPLCLDELGHDGSALYALLDEMELLDVESVGGGDEILAGQYVRGTIVAYERCRFGDHLIEAHLRDELSDPDDFLGCMVHGHTPRGW